MIKRNEDGAGKTPCSVSIGYVQGSDSGRTVRLTIEDEISGCAVAEVTLSLEQWALALSSLGSRPGLMEFHPDNFGKVCETKEEIVSVLPGWKDDETREAARSRNFASTAGRTCGFVLGGSSRLSDFNHPHGLTFRAEGANV